MSDLIPLRPAPRAAHPLRITLRRRRASHRAQRLDDTLAWIEAAVRTGGVDRALTGLALLLMLPISVRVIAAFAWRWLP